MNCPRSRLRGVSAIALFAASVGPCAVYANPEDGSVSSGSASFENAGSTLTVHQTTDKAIIDWRGFDISQGETTNFQQPTSKSVTLNRVNSASASIIDGTLTANGNLVIVNQNGVLFGKNAVVDVNGLVASTADIDNDNFVKENYKFDKPGNPNAAIANLGSITAKEAGLVGLVAPNVLNAGVITAKMGRIHLASGDTATIDLYGDGLMEVKASSALQSQLVANTGKLSAEGGTIALTAASAEETVNSLVHVGGELNATAIGEKSGAIYIYAEGVNAVENNVSADKGKRTGSSTVLVSGKLDASGRKAGERGGKITVTGDNVALLNGSIIDASGSDGTSNTTSNKEVSSIRNNSAGGDIRIGGDYLGQGTTPTAKNLYVSPYAYVFNDALNSGDAGRSIVWSDGATQFYGSVFARALGGKPVDGSSLSATNGGNAGNGGFVETSGHETLDAGGYVNLTASNGTMGSYFMDPTNITIYGNVTPAFTSTDSKINLASSLKLWIDASDAANVILTYNSLGSTATGTSGANTITISDSTGLQIGERIRLGNAGAVTAASTLGVDTYTISAIDGTTITLTSALTSDYSGSTVYGGYVSQLTDKSGNGANATQSTASKMPLWISNGQNGLGTLSFGSSNQYLVMAPAFNSTAGGYNSVFFAMNWSGTTNEVAVSFPSYSIMFLNSGFGYNVGSGQIYGINSTGLPSSWKLVDAVFYNGSITNNAIYMQGQQQSLSYVQGSGGSGTVAIGMHLSGNYSASGSFFTGSMAEVFLYNTSLSADAQALISQYQSTKWNIALTGPGVIGSESGLTGTEAQSAMASVQAGAATDGYSVFSATYLNRLSQTSNIILQASNNVTLDMQGATLTLEAGKNLTLTAGNQITTVSTGGISTSQSSGSGGNITLNATNGIVINNAFSLSSGNGNITLSNATTLNDNLTINAGSGTLAFGSTVNGAHNLTASAASASFNGTLGGTTPLSGVDLASANSITMPSISASSIDVKTTGVSADIILPESTTLSASGAGNALKLKAGRAITIGTSSALTTASGGNIVLWSNAGLAGGNIELRTGTSLTSNGGNVTLAGGSDSGSDGIPDGYAVGTSSNPYGIQFTSATIDASTGKITLHGQGFANASAGSLHGVLLSGSTLLHTTTGNIEIYGTGGVGTGTNFGIFAAGTSTVSTETGAITLSGTAGNGSSDSNYGILFKSITSVQSTGTGSGVGAITIIGQASGTSTWNTGVAFEGGGSISAADAAISVTGIGGGTSGYGVSLDATGGSILSIGTGAITIEGTAAGALPDFYIGGTSGSTYTVGGPSAKGPVTIKANRVLAESVGTISISTQGNIVIKPRTADTTIGINGGGTLAVSSTLLGYLSPGDTLIIGDSASGTGTVTINGWDLRGKTYNVSVYGGPITFSGSAVRWNNPQRLLFSATGTNTSDININQSFIYTGSGATTLTFKAGESVIETSANITASSGTLNLIEWANANNNNNAGNLQISNANITTNGGNVTLAGGLDDGANSGIAGDGIPDNYAQGYNAHIYGIYMNAGGINTGTGNMLMRGQAFSSASNGYLYGILISGGTLQTTSGNIAVYGTGGSGIQHDYGIDLAAATVTSETGSIYLNGTGGAGSFDGYGYGINLSGSTNISSTGSGVDAATITIIGNGASSTNMAQGIGFYGMTINSVDGAVDIEGYAGPSDGFGVLFYNNNSILSTGHASISIAGVGHGAAGIRPAGYADYTNTIGGPSYSGNITLIADTIDTTLNGTFSATTTGSIIVKPYTPSTSIGINGGAGTLNLTSGFLNTLSPSTSLIIGDSSGTNTGAITVDGWDLRGKAYDLSVYGGPITFETNPVLWNNAQALLFSATGTNTSDININTNFTYTGPGTSTLTFKAGESVITASSNLAASSGALNIIEWANANNTSAGNVQITNSTITTNGGNITLGGGLDNGANEGIAGDGIPDNYAWGYGTTANANVYGVYINGGEIDPGSGNLLIRGHGDNSFASSSNLDGVIFSNTAMIHSTSGNISIYGTGGNGTEWNKGIFVASSDIASATGTITLVGTGGNGSSNSNSGVHIDNATIRSTGTGGGAGSINLTGYGGQSTGNNNNYGISIYYNGRISSVDGAINLFGAAGNVYTSYGIRVYAGGKIISSGAANITLTGTGAGGIADLYLDYVNGYTALIGDDGSNTYSGNITLVVDAIGVGASGIGIETTGAITIKPRSAGITVGIGTGAGTLSISETLLSYLSAGSYIFGSTDAGLLTVNTTKDFAASNVSFISGTSINLAGSLSKTSGTGAATYLFQADDDIYNSNSAGISATSGSINLTLQSNHDNDGGAIHLSGGTISTSGGNVTIGGGSNAISAGAGYALGDATFGDGVYLTGTINSGSGNIVINGQGYGVAGAASSNGLYLDGSGSLQTTSGKITLNGLGGTNNGSNQNSGVQIVSSITSAMGDISITGVGGSGGAGFGIWVVSGGNISSTGIGPSAAKISLNGTASGWYAGLGLDIANISSVDGSISITGTATGDWYGLEFYNYGSSVTSTGSASITLTGTSVSGAGDIAFFATIDPGETYAIGGAGASGDITLNATHGSIVFGQPGNAATLDIQTTGAVTFDGAISVLDGAPSNIVSVDAGSITFSSPWGASNALASVSLKSVSSLTLPSINASVIIAETTGANANITIPLGALLSATGSGTPITLNASGNVINASATPFSVVDGARWLVYSSDVSDTVLNGVSPDFVRYSCTYGGSCPALGPGNGVLYRETPLLTVTPVNLASIAYGSAVPTLTGYAYTLSGHLGSDATHDTVSGSLAGTTTYTQGSDVGSYGVSYGSGTLSSSMGYGFTYAANADAITVVPRELTASLIGSISKVYDGTAAATLTSDNYSLAGLYGADTATISTTTGSYASKNVGNAISVTVDGLTFSSAKASNYTLSATSISGEIGRITPAALTITPKAQMIPFTVIQLNTAAYSQNGGNYTYAGLKGSDTASNIGLTFSGLMGFNGSTTTTVKENGAYVLSLGTLSVMDANANYNISFSNPSLNALTITGTREELLPSTYVSTSQTSAAPPQTGASFPTGATGSLSVIGPEISVSGAFSSAGLSITIAPALQTLLGLHEASN